MIQFIQFKLPAGKPETVSIERGKEVEKMAAELVAMGIKFEIEILTTGQVNMDCHHPRDEEDRFGMLVDNGPAVPGAVDYLVKQSYLKWVLNNG